MYTFGHSVNVKKILVFSLLLVLADADWSFIICVCSEINWSYIKVIHTCL